MNRNSMNIRHTIGLVGLAVGLGAMPAAGQATFEWFGTGDGVSFSDPLNWSPSGLPGVLDEARVWNTARTLNEIRSTMNQAVTS